MRSFSALAAATLSISWVNTSRNSTARSRIQKGTQDEEAAVMTAQTGMKQARAAREARPEEMWASSVGQVRTREK
ncbi:hypothetical protein DFJ74DRAFT_654398 [Hyaloraphidium curvatum]|nr:hypothetical protein DFJ74DRAFT_654398 [Hyaloraphidium curvatum]